MAALKVVNLFLMMWVIPSQSSFACTESHRENIHSDDQAIKPLQEIKVQSNIFENQHLEKPIIIHSAEQVARYFEAESVDKILGLVDFQKQTVVLFAWQGSGQDRLDYIVQESWPETIQFNYQPGRTRDLRQHFFAYAVRSNVNLRIGEKQISLAADSDDREYVRVEVRGRLDSQVMAIGGETTGIVIKAGNIEWELDCPDPELRNRAQELHLQTVIVKGELELKPGVEIPTRWIVKVSAMEPSSKPK